MARLREIRSRSGIEGSRGFSFIELLFALAATVIVMGVVFGLLAQGSGAHTVELERTDLQAQARAALHMLSQDVLMAGGDLPPEIPALRDAPVGIRNAATDSIEILGNSQDDAGGAGALPVVSFDGRLAKLGGDPVRFFRGDLVLVYDDQPTDGKWMFGLVESVQRGAEPEMALMTAAGQGVDDVDPPIALPPTIDSYNRPTPESGFVTPITVIGYGVDDAARSSLWRQVNWGERVDVAYVEGLEIQYFVGGTVGDPVVPSLPKAGPRGGPSIFGNALGRAQEPDPPDPPAVGTDSERETDSPPLPQPDPSQEIREGSLIRGVRFTVTTRSNTANLRGSTLESDQAADAEAYIRNTISTRVAPRNLLIQAERRKQQLDAAELQDPESRSPGNPRRR